MDDILKLADNLVDAVKNSEAYKNYLKSKKEIEVNSELNEKVKKFRKIHMDYQTKKLNNEEISFDYEKYVSGLYYSLIKNEEVKMFFENEQIVIQLINKIYGRFFENWEIGF